MLEQFSAAVWEVGRHFGAALSQNAQGELIGHVIDATAEDPTPRMYRSNLELRPHNDITAMIALACWQKARSGGASVLVSGVTVHDEMQRRPGRAGSRRCTAASTTIRLGESGQGEEPVTPYRMPVVHSVRDGEVSLPVSARGNRGGASRAGASQLEPDELAALDLFDEVARAPESRGISFLDRGDMLVINNYTIMHARTQFTEFPEPEAAGPGAHDRTMPRALATKRKKSICSPSTAFRRSRAGAAPTISRASTARIPRPAACPASS